MLGGKVFWRQIRDPKGDFDFDRSGLSYTRKKLVLMAANKEGGAHLDKLTLPRSMKELRRGSKTVSRNITVGGNAVRIDTVWHNSVRQMAHEVLFMSNLPELARFKPEVRVRI